MKRYGLMRFFIISLVFITLPAASLWAQIENPPAIDDQYNSAKMCDLGELRNLQVEATGDSLVYSLINSPGSIDSLTGLISYVPDTSGHFIFEVQVTNSLGSDVAFVYDDLILNSPPQVFCYDSTVFLCNPEEISFTVSSSDVDGDSVQINMFEGLGSFTMVDDSSGLATFMPSDLDSAVYQFIFRATDSCVLSQSGDKNNIYGLCCVDTSLITVIINHGPDVSDPGPQNFFICGDSSFSFDFVVTDPENDVLNITVTTDEAHAGQISYDGQTITVIATITEQLRLSQEEVEFTTINDVICKPNAINDDKIKMK